MTSQSGYVLDTLEAALAHTVYGLQQPQDGWILAVERAALLGDDSDTVACVMGAALGAAGQAVPAPLLPDLRLGHTWPGWERSWSAQEHLPPLLARAQAAVQQV
ncbi:ADP-ribosylglycohydrolase family protein [Deinococcus lacus]|uniref:ADP-ribosylglycohydrolase family protein n=1 Tax=Deinococcus lacus TaxID=392561 RepID=A0ABW1YDW2_9DEIO